MAQLNIPGTVPVEDASGNATPTSPTAGMPIPTPKLKGRHRFLKGLQRISSSPSLAKLGRSPSVGYRTGERGSISCVSLASASTYGHSYNNSYSSQSSGTFSTAPTSLASTPGLDAQLLDSNARVPILDNDTTTPGNSTPTRIALPADLRPNSRSAPLAVTPEICEVVEDYFSRPIEKQNVARQENFDLWGNMPDEIRMEVFRYLKPKEIVRCSRVSRTWHKMCFDGQLWGDLDVSDFYRDIPGDSLAKIIRTAGPFVKNLNLRGCIQLRDHWEGEKMSGACRNLIDISLEGCRIDSANVHYFLLRNTRLVRINIAGLSAVTNSSMRIIAKSCPQLEHLNVSWCSNMDTRGLSKIMDSCPRLKDLRASEIRGFDDKDFMLELFQLNKLERLVIDHCESLDDESLKIMVQGLDPEIDPLSGKAIVPPRKLKHLDLTRCRNLSDTGIQSLAGHVPNLEGLQLSQCDHIHDDGLTDLLASASKLTHLDLEELEELTNATLQTIAKSPCKDTLQHLVISYCENLGDTGMLPLIKACRQLKSVDMDNTRISDLVLAEAASMVRSRSKKDGSPHKRPRVGLRLVVYDCQNVTWTGVREVLSRNAEVKRPKAGSLAPPYPSEIIQLKCFYGWQMTVEEHTKRVLRGDLAAASRLERKWAEYMMANEEAGAGGAGSRRRRRRAREAAMLHADEEEGGEGMAGIGRRRRARSGNGCTVM